MRRACHALLLACAVALSCQAQGATESEREIEYLLQYLANSGCTFIRNGDKHDSAEAADHMRLKYSRGKRYVDSAEQFIERLATESSWSGDPYTVTCDGTTQTSAQWLHRALVEYRRMAAAQAAPNDL